MAEMHNKNLGVISIAQCSLRLSHEHENTGKISDPNIPFKAGHEN